MIDRVVAVNPRWSNNRLWVYSALEGDDDVIVIVAGIVIVDSICFVVAVSEIKKYDIE